MYGFPTIVAGLSGAIAFIAAGLSYFLTQDSWNTNQNWRNFAGWMFSIQVP